MTATPAERAFAEAAAQGLPKYIEDPLVLDRIAAIFLAAELAQKNVRDGKGRRRRTAISGSGIGRSV